MHKVNALNFWSEFSKNSTQIAHEYKRGKPQAAFDRIERMLDTNGMSFCFDLTGQGDRCCLVFSPEGETVVAKEIDSLLACAPNIAGWIVYGRRQAKHPSDVRAIINHLFSIDPACCRFLVDCRGAVSVQILLPTDSDMEEDVFAGFGKTLLWHALGEGCVMERGITSVVRRAADSPTSMMTFDEFMRFFQTIRDPD